jgi:hypothetical protein
MESTQIALRMTALLLTTTGSLLIAVAVLHLHSVEFRDQKFDENVLLSIGQTRKFSIAGIILLSFAGVMAIVAEIFALINL